VFDPTKTRSARNLLADVYIERFVAVRDRVFPRMCHAADPFELPSVVEGVFKNVFA
jgi:hypothetical protein